MAPPDITRNSTVCAASALIFVAACLWSAPSEANVRARPSMTAELAAPLGDNTHLTIDRETLTLRCDQDGNRSFCDVEAVYTISNPTHARQTTEASFVGFLTSRVHVTLDGEPVRFVGESTGGR